MAYTTSIQSTTGQSPFLLMSGRRARIPVDMLFGMEQAQVTDGVEVGEYVAKQSRILQEACSYVQDTMKLHQDRQKELYDRKIHGKPFEFGDQVMLHSSVIPLGHSRKLYCPWTGPYKVIKNLSDITYRIQRCHDRKGLVVHFSRL